MHIFYIIITSGALDSPDGGKIEHVHSEDSDSNPANEDPSSPGHQGGHSKVGGGGCLKGELEKAVAELAQLKMQQERHKQEVKVNKSEISELKQVTPRPINWS